MNSTTTRRPRHRTPTLGWETIIRLEDAIHRAGSLTGLVVSKYAASIDEDSASEARLVVGLVTLEKEILEDLWRNFEQVCAYAQQLKTLSSSK